MPLPVEMTSIEMSAFGDADVLVPTRVPVPTPRSGDVLVRVAAAGVNRPDILQRQGKYPLPPDALPTLGLEVAGDVAALGEGVAGFSIGDRVCGLTNGGGYAEYCPVPAGQLLPWPSGFDAIQSAALPETFFTVWANLFQAANVRAGETVLIHGGASGIGTTALLLCRAFGVRTLATAGSAEKCEAIRRLGAEIAVNYREQDFAEVVRSATNGRGVDAILDIVGADYFQRNLASLAPGGRLILLAFLGGTVAEKIDLRPILLRHLIVTGSTMRPRSAAEKAAIARDLREQVWPRLGLGRIEPVIHAVLPLERAAEAHRLMESNQHIGKIVLKVGGAASR